MKKTKETVPFDGAAVTKLSLTFEAKRVRLKGQRTVAVGVSTKSDKSRIIIITSPTEDGKISELKFGLSFDAAQALGFLLAKARQRELDKERGKSTAA